MIQAGHNWKFVATFVALVAAVAWAVALVSAGLLMKSDVFPALTHIGVATLAGSVAAVVLNRYLWRWPILTPILNLPDLSGRWEGWSFRSLEKERGSGVNRVFLHFSLARIWREGMGSGGGLVGLSRDPEVVQQNG